MKAFVTGATGLLGGAIARRLAERGDEVVALVRSRQKGADLLGDLPDGAVEFVQGDVRDPAGFRAKLAGVGAVFHTAAYFREYYEPGDHSGALEATNVVAVRELIKAADGAGVPVLVHTSTIGVVGESADGAPSDESTPPDARALRNGYHASKKRAEDAVRELLADDAISIRIPIVLPGWLFGPADAAPTSSGKLVLDIANGRLPAIPPGGNHATDARDVAAVAVAAADRAVSDPEASGRRYIAAAPWQPMADIVAAFARAAGSKPPSVRLNPALALALATASQIQSRLTGRPALATRDGIRALIEPRRVTSDRAITELGAAFRPLADSAADEIAWYRAHGRIAA
ncbi:MAG: SDR family NAD(P)-dependent oxidoreductase [Actinocrinis sp.]